MRVNQNTDFYRMICEQVRLDLDSDYHQIH